LRALLLWNRFLPIIVIKNGINFVRLLIFSISKRRMMIQLSNKKILKSILCLIVISVLIILVSCSAKVSKYTYVSPRTYLSPEYEDKTFDDASMDICYVNSKHDYNGGLDSLTVSNINHFNESFKKYFADGIKMFSSVTKTGWILYNLDEDFIYNSIEYRSRTRDGTEINVLLTDSLSIFQRKSSADFLFFVHNITVSQNGPKQGIDNPEDNNEYESIVYIDYSIWNKKNSDLITKDRVTTRRKFKRLAGKWPFRGVVLKSSIRNF
jgi:hypothetical protein